MRTTRSELLTEPCSSIHSKSHHHSGICDHDLHSGSARVDGLAKREILAVEMTEHFENREDFLCYRHVVYEKPARKFEPADKTAKKTGLPILVDKHSPVQHAHIYLLYVHVLL